MSRDGEPPWTRDIDQGWAWVILCVSFMCLVICGGALYSVSVFNVIFLEEFGESKALTSWIGSILIGLYALVGPLSSLITARLGWRVTVILGGLLATLGTLTSSLATNIVHMFLSFGFLTGVGHGLIYTPAIVVVGYYFERRRTMASGVASVGAGIGMMVFPPAITYLRRVFSWREIMVFMAGVNLHICVLGALMRPLPLVGGPPDEAEGGRTPSNASRQSSRGTLYDLELQYLQIRMSTKSKYVEQYEDDSEDEHHVCGSGYLSQNLSIQSERLCSEQGAAGDGAEEDPEVLGLCDRGREPTDALSLTSAKDNPSVSLSYDLVALDDEPRLSAHGGEWEATKQLTVFQEDQLRFSDSPKPYGSILNSKPDISRFSPTKDTGAKEAKLKATTVRFQKQSNTVCNAGLAIFCASIFTAGIGLSTVYLHLSAFAMEHGASEHEASILISILGVSSIASRVFTGLAGNDHTIDNLILYIGTFGVAGMCTLLCPLLVGSYFGRILYAVAFGFYGSCFNVLLAPLTVELVGLDALNMSFGIVMAVCGTAYLLGPPLAGQLYDMTHNYSTSFYLSGCCLIISAVVMLFVAVTRKSQLKRGQVRGDRVGQA